MDDGTDPPPASALLSASCFSDCIFFNDIPRSLAARPRVTIRSGTPTFSANEKIAFCCSASKMAAAAAGSSARTASYSPGFVPLTH